MKNTWQEKCDEKWFMPRMVDKILATLSVLHYTPSVQSEIHQVPRSPTPSDDFDQISARPRLARYAGDEFFALEVDILFPIQAKYFLTPASGVKRNRDCEPVRLFGGNNRFKVVPDKTPIGLSAEERPAAGFSKKGSFFLKIPRAGRDEGSKPKRGFIR